MEATPELDLIDVAFIVCTALDRNRMVSVLTGGSAATYDAPAAYQSRDADFVIVMTGSLALAGKALTHFTLEFPPGPLLQWARHRKV